MDNLANIVDSTTSPVGIIANLLCIFYARNAVPVLPSSVDWIQSNFFTRVFLVGLLIYQSRIVGKNLQNSILLAAAVIAGANLYNGQPILGQSTIAGVKLPF